MAKLRSIAMLMALGLTGAAWAAQTPPPPAPGDAQAAPPTGTEPESTQNPDPQSASSPHQRDVTKQPASEATPNESPDPDAASTPHQRGTVGETPRASMAGQEPKIVGLQVQSPSGQSLGSVIDVTMDAQRMPEYAVISTGSDTMTAVPYKTLMSMVKGDKVILDRTKLQNSPQVAQSELRDKSNSKWRADADKYWAGDIRTATPGAGTDKPIPKDR
jgi:hypothetical protein